MKVILKDSKEVKDVPLGYAVNYLLPRGLAVVATKAKLAKLASEEKEAESEKSLNKQQNRQQAEKINGKVVTLTAKAGKTGTIHGGITKKEIAKELKVLKTNVVLLKPIKKIGEYEVELKFGSFKAEVKVKVEAK
jgi:large subunit ribosomal protein L9